MLRVTRCTHFTCASLVLHRLQLLVHDVHLRVSDGEDVAVCGARAGSGALEFKLHAVLCIDQPLPAAVHCGVSHGAQVDPEAKLVAARYLARVMLGLPPGPAPAPGPGRLCVCPCGLK